ncbi:Putative aminopeptidase YsdC [Maioricimonas rarisocia]|uniref:Aminopeptidase YsdC n=1 Tax=Maioricimonas rarisocia TaxID=2528026 RepID=A0A517Z6N1_9PLAN|nr:M20/M25/M40 family metallo-hydrolase [Maioricimonas rarisocia]QDU38152.1 Putative aminopeptidase YsdC [Maioricimonas rarisocia]
MTSSPDCNQPAGQAEALLAHLRRLTDLDAPTGFEEPVLRYMSEQLGSFCEQVEHDVRGNVYASLAGTTADALRIMITAHADEIGFLVTSVLADGFLRFTRLGHPTEMVLPGQRVRVHTASGSLEGVIGVKPGHVLAASEARTVPPVSEQYIDIGATSQAEAVEWGIEPGTPVTFHGPLTATAHPQRYFGKAVDNRAGCACLLELAKRLRQKRPEAHLEFVVVVEEEIGLRGAEVATRRVQPDVVIAIDTVPSGGTPDLRPDELPWQIGGGPLLKVRETKGLSTHGPLRNLFRRVADEQGIPYQLIVDTAGITDATSAQQASGDVAAMTIGLARRYSHSAAELFDLRDVSAIVDLIAHTCGAIASRDQLLRT